MSTFPSSIATAADLLIAENKTNGTGTPTTLSAEITSVATTIPVVSTAGYPASGCITIDDEIIKYDSIDADSFNECTRGYDNTTAAVHVIASVVEGNIVAAHHNVLANEIIAIETALSETLTDVATIENNIATIRKNGYDEPTAADMIITQTAAVKSTNATLQKRYWVWQHIIRDTDKLINGVRLAIVRDLSATPGVFTGDIEYKIGIDSAWVLSGTIALAELAYYNALDYYSPADAHAYDIEFTDRTFEVGQKITVALRAASGDKIGGIFGTDKATGVEGREGLFNYSDSTDWYAAANPPTLSAQSITLYGKCVYLRYGTIPKDTRTTLTLQSPAKVYTVQNDILPQYANVQADAIKNRRAGIPLYIDHMKSGLTEEPDFCFANQAKDHVTLFSPESYDDGSIFTHDPVESDSLSIPVTGGTLYNDTSITVERVSTKESVGESSFPKVLFIGDSITGMSMADFQVPNETGPEAYWAVVREEFEKARIDNGDSASYHKMLTVGGNVSRDWTLTYGSVNGRAMKAFAEGRGGWATQTYAFYSRLWTSQESQGFWDLLGLGNGSGTDFTGSFAQVISIRSTPEGKNAPTNTTAFRTYLNSQLGLSTADYASAKAALEAFEADPDNPFYDKTTAEAGTIAFSLKAYYDRYKTLASDGVTRLIVGSTAGSKVTDATDYDVCIPTHIIIQLSHNDGDSTIIEDNLRLLTDQIQAEYSANSWGDVYIGLSILDACGTYYPSLYPDFDDTSFALWNQALHSVFYANYARVVTEFASDEANGIYILPTGFVMPTAHSMAWREIPSPLYDLYGGNENIYKKAVGGAPSYHPNAIGHRAIGLEMYAWIRYTLSL